METKLTLKLDKNKIEKAKLYAKKHQRSLSSLVSDYFSILIERDELTTHNISPIVKELIGVIRTTNTDNKFTNIRDKYLLEKYFNE